ncbi:hypothetical protein [Salinithrix halophila]|uniref:Uncharacterized protein n=1 Tax=Salinithrix halophila TaxID=1485204 RepID=A0ABV8JC50_9BACL
MSTAMHRTSSAKDQLDIVEKLQRMGITVKPKSQSQAGNDQYSGIVGKHRKQLIIK